MSGAEILVVLGASLIGAFVKSVTGMGYPLLAVPLATLAVGVEDAVVVIALPNLVANAVLCFDAREGRTASRDLPRILVPGVIGAVVGTVALVNLPEEPLLVALAVTIALFVVSATRHPELHLTPATTHRWSPVAGGIAGVMQGAVGVSGPIVAAWVHGYRLSKQAYVFSVTMIFGITGAIQAALLIASGELTLNRLGVSALAFVPVLVVLPIGARLRDRLGGPGFERAVLGVIIASGVAVLGRLAT